MEKFKYFFRGTEDGFTFKLFSPIHLILLAIFVAGILLIRFKFDKKTVAKMNKTLAIILLIDQVILYIWQFSSGYFRIDMSLPLYHCRVAVWFLIIGILFNQRIIKITGFYLGFIGSIIGMLLADLYKFSFPHYTNFQFFIVHIFMGWMVAGLLFAEREPVTKKEIKSVAIALNILNAIIMLANIVLIRTYPEVNYGYFLSLPNGMGPYIPPVLNAIIMLIVFNLGLWIIYKLLNKIMREDRNESY